MAAISSGRLTIGTRRCCPFTLPDGTVVPCPPLPSPPSQLPSLLFSLTPDALPSLVEPSTLVPYSPNLSHSLPAYPC